MIKNQKYIIILKNNSSITTKELMIITNLSESYVNKIFHKLKDNNLIKRIGSNKNGYWQIIK